MLKCSSCNVFYDPYLIMLTFANYHKTQSVPESDGNVISLAGGHKHWTKQKVDPMIALDEKSENQVITIHPEGDHRWLYTILRLSIQ